MIVVRESKVTCVGERAALFDLVSDTDRLNRESGLAEIEFEASVDGSSNKIVRQAHGPLTLEYLEHPWEWQRPERIHVRREYKNGPLEILDVHFRFAELHETTSGSASEAASRSTSKVEVTCRLEGTPRGLMAPLLGPMLKRTATKLGATIERMAHLSTERPETSLKVLAHPRELARAEQALLALLDPRDREIALKLVSYLAHSADHEIVRIRPYELATRWGTDRRRTLETCLHGVIAGLLELTWDIVCPSCRVGAQRIPTLSEANAQGHCTMCDLGFGVSLDQAIEATFLPAPSIRPARQQQYCTGGPAWTPHVVAQANLHPDETVDLQVPEAPTAAEEPNWGSASNDPGQTAARYRLFLRGGATAAVVLGPDYPEHAAAAQVGDEIRPKTVQVRSGGRIHITGDSAALGRHVKLERMDWASYAATAHDVVMLPDFRRQFSEQLLREGLALKVLRVALLFSDLSGSTALYTREGDAAAFTIVQDHFDLLRTCIEENDGVIIKTIGDAVMAAFLEESKAIRAALRMQRAFPEFRATHPKAAHVFLKIGVHAGPCYAVTANGVLDYFGQTVNLAARLQSQAHDAEVVVTEECGSRAQQEQLLEGVEVDPSFSAKLKGVEPEIRSVRMRIATDAPPHVTAKRHRSVRT